VNKDVIISVKGTQLDIDNVPSVLELVTEGKFYKENDSYYVAYNESEVTGMEGTTTTLKLDNDAVTLVRTGAINSQFVFKQGQRHLSYYDTDFGSFTISVFASDVFVNVDDNGGEIKVEYRMEIDNSSTGSNKFHMLIREAGRSDEFNREPKTTDKGYC
jgi:uncharacterized beta-barrel protein YwiB (DUF1934 family)